MRGGGQKLARTSLLTAHVQTEEVRQLPSVLDVVAVDARGVDPRHQPVRRVDAVPRLRMVVAVDQQFRKRLHRRHLHRERGLLRAALVRSPSRPP
eukprot:3704784-Pleurochrysis_carterae.AAC.2